MPIDLAPSKLNIAYIQAVRVTIIIAQSILPFTFNCSKITIKIILKM